MEVRTTFRGTAVSGKGLGAVLMALIVAVGALLAISLASAGSARPAATTAPSHMVVVGQLGEHGAPVVVSSATDGLSDRESGQPAGGHAEPSNGYGFLP